MSDFIDIHSHILPNVDDGATDLNMTKEMLKIAWKDGISTLFATPHYHPTRGRNDIRSWKLALAKAQKAASEIDYRMRVIPGCEILYQHGIIKLLHNGELWTLANSNYVLVEFPLYADYSYILKGIQELRFGGYLPILAHVERYQNVAKVERVEELIDMGAYIQVNTDTVLKSKGLLRGQTIRKLLRNELVHFIGTDAHENRVRKPVMRECAAYIESLCDREYSELICGENAWKVVNKEII